MSPVQTTDIDQMELEIDQPELSTAERIDTAFNAWKEANGTISLRKAAKQHGIGFGTLQARSKGSTSRESANQAKQRVSVQEEEAIRRWILQLGAWGWPPLVSQVNRMAIEVLKAKGDTEPLGHNWHSRFLDRHPDLRSRFVPPLDKERLVATDPEQIQRYFELFAKVKAEKKIHDDDVWNMDEKGVMMGVIAKVRVVVDRGIKHPYMTQPGGREWVSLIECVCSNGRVLSPWVIFKAKKQVKAWFEHFPDSHICISERGWTDNELCL
jgi:hypothetical protein